MNKDERERIYNAIISSPTLEDLLFLFRTKFSIVATPSVLDCLSEVYSRYRASRFLEILTLDRQQKIIDDLNMPVKRLHYMWYGFPQQRDSWGSRSVSENTLKYAMTREEARSYLRIPGLLSFYIQAIHLVRKKARTKRLKNYFGPIDFIKLGSHLQLFLDAALSLGLQELVGTIVEILGYYQQEFLLHK
jgi:uncharacterized protein (DUF1810 family)